MELEQELSVMEPSASSSQPESRHWLEQVTQGQAQAEIPEFTPGDQIRVWCKIQEKDRIRLVPFEGTVVRRRGEGFSKTFTVRRVTHGEGVERVFPVRASILERIEVLRRTKVRRARLYFLRTKVGKTRFADADSGGSAKSSAQSGQEPKASSSGSEPEAPAAS